MAGWVLKLVLFWLVARAIVKLVRGIYEGMSGTAPSPPSVALVRDPVCGTFVTPASAPSVGTGSQMRFFCSENCRRIYQAKFAR
jgi:YHS domain-containing protein